MTPSFDDLVGTDLPAEERARLELVHELLIAAGPPPAGAPQRAPEPAPARPASLRPRRRTWAAAAVAAALAIAAFALGAAASGDSGRSIDFVAEMHGTSTTPGAEASLVVHDVDAAGNWPMELSVTGLPPATEGRTFELWLTRDGELDALCGGFLTDADGSASVPLNAPYRFDDGVGWVVVERGSTTPLLTT